MPANRGTPPRVGRPRAKGPSDSELTPRAEVLAAAAELFTVNGYAAPFGVVLPRVRIMDEGN